MAAYASRATRVTVTPRGQRRLREAERVITAAMERSMRRAATEYKRILASTMPDPEEEAQLLSEGIAFGNRIGSQGMVGTPDDDRFLKVGMLSLRAAIMASPITVTVTGPQITITTAADQDINRRSGFSWATRRRGIVGPTLPFNRRLMQAMNDGGVWEVRRRTENMLNPEDDVYTPRMIKTLPPRGGRQIARAEVRELARADLRRAVARALRQVGA